jgi:hypothetical protein
MAHELVFYSQNMRDHERSLVYMHDTVQYKAKHLNELDFFSHSTTLAWYWIYLLTWTWNDSVMCVCNCESSSTLLYIVMKQCSERLTEWNSETWQIPMSNTLCKLLLLRVRCAYLLLK